MEFKYHRQNPLDDVPVDTLNEAFQTIEYFFDSTWLNTKGDHELQKLWQRTDSLSTIELFIFGHSLQLMKGIDENWVKGQVKNILQPDSNNRRGAYFEIIGLSFFSNENLVSPSRNSQPGYDGIVTLQSGKEVIISCKKYGLSKFHKEFEEKAIQIEKTVQVTLAAIGMNAVQVLVEFTEYPSKEDWEAVRLKMYEVLVNFSNSNEECMFYNSSEIGVMIIVAYLTNNISEYAPLPAPTSYTFSVISPHHFNEQRNIFSKIEEANINFTKHQIALSGKTNMLFIQLPVNTSIEKCKEWVEEYFEREPQCSVKVVLLYQPSLSSDVNSSIHTTALTHCINFVFNPNFINDILADFISVPLNVHVGRLTLEPPQLELFAGDQRTHHKIKNSYVYQRGDHFKMAKVVDEGKTIEGTMARLGFGLYQHSVVSLPEGKFVVKRVDPEKDELIIL